MNENKNLFGRVTALILILGAAYGANAIAHGGFSCGLGGGSHCCVMASPEAAVPAAAVKRVPAETDGDSEDDAKAPTASPEKPE